jgi:hypothetical protein
MLNVIFPVALVLLIAACSAQQSETSNAQNGSRVEYSHTTPGADFSRYRGLLFVPLEIMNADHSAMAPSNDLASLRGEFRRAFIAAMNGEYMILTRAAPDVVRIKAQLINASYSPAASSAGAGLSFDELTAGGQLSFSMLIEDSYSNKVLVRASDRYSLGASRTDEEKQQRITAAAGYWAGLFKEFLDENLPDARTR